MPFSKISFHPSRLDQPLRWKKPRRIFVGSMTDIFHPDVEANWLLAIYTRIQMTPRHTFMVLTKRPERMMVNAWPPLPNLFLGVTAENQEAADERIPILLQTPAAVRFVSVEPMLGPVNLSGFMPPGIGLVPRSQIPNWIICGGESGPGARPMHPDWPRSLRDQCQAAGVPFFFKQWGEWSQFYDRDKDDPDWRNCPKCPPPNERYVNLEGGHGFHGERVVAPRRVGKKAAGCLLDGKEHKEFPEVKG